MEEAVYCTRRVMAPSQISTATHIIFALLFCFAFSLYAGFASYARPASDMYSLLSK
jgi:hypothetical protein